MEMGAKKELKSPDELVEILKAIPHNCYDTHYRAAIL